MINRKTVITILAGLISAPFAFAHEAPAPHTHGTAHEYFVVMALLAALTLAGGLVWKKGLSKDQ